MDLNKSAQYCSFLEDTIKCPVCHKRLTGDVVMCDSGHSICGVCKYGSSLCTQCHKPYTAIPNLLAQHLLLQLDDIKTCLNEYDTLKSTKNQKRKSNSGLKNNVLRGQYPCWITAHCKFHGFFLQIIKHAKDSHPHEMQELGDGFSLPYKQSWQMNYAIGNNLNRMFNIPKIGLFILQLFRDEYNELRGSIIMYAGAPLASQHHYKIEIECGHDKISHNGQVSNARIPKHNVPQFADKGLLIDRNQFMYNTLNKNLIFNCSITLERKNENVIDVKNSNNSNNQLNQHEKKHFNKSKNVNSNRETDKQQSTVGSSKNFAEQNRPRSNNASSEQLLGSRSSVQLDIDQSGTKKSFNAPQNKLYDAIKQLEIIPQQSSIINQLSKLKQCYPNLNAYEDVKNTTANFIPPAARHNMMYQYSPNIHQTSQMFNNHGSSVNVSAPYEIPPPTNPYFQQHATNFKDTGAIFGNNGKKKTKCIVA